MARDHSTIAPFPINRDRDRFGDWLTGFTDGEGSFVLAWHKKRSTGTALFRIALRRDDRDTLQLVRSYFGCGWLNLQKPNKATKNSKPMSLFCVSKTSDLVRLVIPHFEAHPLVAKKRNDFLIWRQGVELLKVVTRRDHTRKFGFAAGFASRWSDDEREQFWLIREKLREQRRYEKSVAAMQPHIFASRRPQPSHLFLSILAEQEAEDHVN